MRQKEEKMLQSQDSDELHVNRAIDDISSSINKTNNSSIDDNIVLTYEHFWNVVMHDY